MHILKLYCGILIKSKISKLESDNVYIYVPVQDEHGFRQGKCTVDHFNSLFFYY